MLYKNDLYTHKKTVAVFTLKLLQFSTQNCYGFLAVTSFGASDASVDEPRVIHSFTKSHTFVSRQATYRACKKKRKNLFLYGFEEVVAFVVNKDECREVFYLNLPDGFHA